MKKKINKIILLFVIGLLLMSGIINFSKGWKNNGNGKLNELNQGTYTFVDYVSADIGRKIYGQPNRKVNSYGVHDWIADSGLRLILEHPVFGKFAEKIFPSGGDIDLSQIHSLGVTEEPNGEVYFNWYINEIYTGSNREDYLKLRRYINFLWGTYLPDKYLGKNTIIKVEENFVPEEEIFFSYPEMRYHDYGLTLTKIEKDKYFYKETRLQGILGAEWHAQMAYFFSKIETKVSYDNGQTYETIKGKYEAMAQALGAMAHYIADMSYPGHLIHDIDIPNRNAMLGLYNSEVEEELNCHFSTSTFQNGGPDWQSFNFNALTIKPQIPYFAARDVGMKTFDGKNGKEEEVKDVDADFNGEIFLFKTSDAAMNMNPTNPSAHILRLEELITHAVHQTANALAFMLIKCLNNTSHEDTIGKRATKKDIIILDEIELGVPSETPSSYEEIEDILKSANNNSEKVNDLTSVLQVGLTSLLGLIIVALLEQTIKILTKEVF